MSEEKAELEQLGPRSRTLELVELGHPVLRQKARELSREEILSPEIQELIEQMKNTMRAAPGVGLAAPQVGRSLQLAVIEDVYQSQLTPEQIEERQRYGVPLHVIINPRLFIEEESKKCAFYEGCLTMPTWRGVVPRAESVRVECLDASAEPVVIHAKGWYARILQHEIDHLNGKLYIDRVLLETLTTNTCYEEYWEKMSVNEALERLKP